MRLTDEQQTSVDDALYPKMQPVTDYSADPGLGVYSPSTTQPVQDYSLGFGGSPVTSYSTPDANNDGLNDTTGWAMGVQQDQSSPTGFSYNGQPTQSNGALYTAPQPTSYGQPAWTPNSWDQPAPQPTDYSLGFNGTAFNGYDNPNAVSPWDANAPQAPQDNGGFWGGVKDFVQPGIDAFTNSPIVAAPIIAGNAASGLLDQWTGTSRQQRINDQLSGNALVKDVSQGNVDLNQLPYGLGYVTDAALAPASYLGWGATGGAGATAWEGVKQIGSGAIGNAAAKFGASDTAAQIPVYGDQPAWARALEAGAVGGIAGYGAIGGIGNAAKEAGGFGPLLKSEVGSTPPLGKGEDDIARLAKIERKKLEQDIAKERVMFRGPEAEAMLAQLRTDDRAMLSFAGDGLQKQWVSPRGLTDAEKQRLGDINIALGPAANDVPTAAVTQAVTPPLTAATDTSLNPIRRKIADALDAEAKFRNSGEAEAIKSVKRGEQAAGLNAVQAGATSADTLANVSAGAKVGKFFDNTPGIKLPEADYNAALTDIVNSTDGFDKIQAVKALQKLQNGERLQPGEIKTLGKLYGPEVEAKIRMTNANRIQTIADLTPEDTARIARQAEVDGKRIATLEVTAQRQHQLADNLQKQSFMDPTNKSLKTAAENARARALKQQNDADRLLADRAEKMTSNLPQRTETQILRGEQATTGTAKQALQADKVALRNANKDFFRASPEQAVTKAKDVVAKLDVPDSLKSQLIDTIELGARKQSIILDGMGDSGPGILRKIYAGATGEVTDSYTSRLLTQRAFIQNALESTGLDKTTAKQIGKLLQDAELRMKYGDNIPEWVTKSLDEAKFNFNEGGAIKGLADISQELKNTQFGIGDAAVFGQQTAKAGLTNAPQLVVGYVNRVLQAHHLGGVNTALPEAAIARDTQYALDGLALHSHGITDIVSNERTLISRLGKPGKIIDDKLLLPIIKRLTDFQFDTVLGNLRKTIYEGNLVMAHVSGADINSPIVRQRAAEMANAATGAGKLAQRSARANAEKAFMLSPSMRRAQVQQWGQVIKGLTHQDTALSSALAITSSVGVTLAVGKLLSDYTNIPFETDPSKPGFGNIRLPDGTTINPFAQEQIAKAFARSIRILAEDQSPDAAKKVTEEWGKILVSSASPAIRPFLASAGVGIDQNGYHWGDLGQGQSWGQRLLNAAPIPPLASSIIQNGVSPVRTPLEALGVNAYPESPYQALDGKVKNDPQFGGKGYSDLSPTEKQLAQQKYGTLPAFGPEGQAAQEVLKTLTTQQQASDSLRKTGQLTPEDWRRDYSARKEELAVRNDQIYSKLNLQSKDAILSPYYSAIDSAKGADGKINWDQVDSYVAGLPKAQQDYISTNTGLVKISTPETQAFQKEYKAIQNSGYFERSDQNWQQVASLVPTWDKLGNPVNPKDYQSYDAWRQAALQAGLKLAGKTTEDIATVTEINSWLDKQDPAKGQAYYTSQWSDEWIAANPRAAYDAWRYGYLNPKKEIKAWLASKFE